MRKLKNILLGLKKDESGAAAIEYGLLAGLISIAIIAGATTAGTQIKNIFTTIGTDLTAAAADVK